MLFASVTLVTTAYAESRTCVNCVHIPSYEVDYYKHLFPLTIWTDSITYDHFSTITVNGYLKPQNTVAPVLVTVTNPVGNIVTVKQFSPDADGAFSFVLNTQSPLMTQNGEYVIKAQSGTETRQFKTSFTLVSSLSGSADCSSNKISVFANNGRTYCIPFMITSGSVTNTSGKLNSDTNTVTLGIKGHDIDSVVLDIPRYILDSKSPAGDDSVFVVTSNGKIINYQELESDSDSRQIKLNFPDDNSFTFEIIGTHVIPEFGSISVIILISSIMSILVISKLFSSKFVKF